MVYIPGLGGSSFPGGLAGIPGTAGASGSNGFVVLGTATLGATGDGFDVSLSTALTPNRSVLIVADLELATASNPDFQIFPVGATLVNYTYRFWSGASAGTGNQPRVARVASAGAIGMRVNISGVLTLDEAQKLNYSGKHFNSTLAQYGLAAYYGTSETQSSVSSLTINSTVSGALAAGSKISVFQLW